jgi:predicted  nucleic acid-binding Zn-ribbon protein
MSLTPEEQKARRKAQERQRRISELNRQLARVDEAIRTREAKAQADRDQIEAMRQRANQLEGQIERIDQERIGWQSRREQIAKELQEAENDTSIE